MALPTRNGDAVRPIPASHKHQLGLTYLWVLFAVMLLGLGLGKSLEIHHHQIQREKETELIYAGEQYRQAIRSYYLSSPGTLKRYPATLDNLLLDKRLLTRRRHIRRLYSDPMTSNNEWGIIRVRDGGIIGVYSRSESRPIKQTGFPPTLWRFSDASAYYQWQFIAGPDA